MKKSVNPFASLDFQLFKIDVHPEFCFSQGKGARIKWNLSQHVGNVLLGFSWEWRARFVWKSEEIQTFDCGCMWQTSKCPLSCWEAAPLFPTRRKSASFWHRAPESCLRFICCSDTGTAFRKCICVCARVCACLLRGVDVVTLPAAVAICYTGTRQTPFNLYWGIDKWVMTQELFLLGDRSKDWWSTREGTRDRKKLVFQRTSVAREASERVIATICIYGREKNSIHFFFIGVILNFYCSFLSEGQCFKHILNYISFKTFQNNVTSLHEKYIKDIHFSFIFLIT